MHDLFRLGLDGAHLDERMNNALAFAVDKPWVPHNERMQDPAVGHHRDFAQLWAHYDFLLGDSLSHCGHDAVQLAQDGDKWRILGITYTYNSCP